MEERRKNNVQVDIDGRISRLPDEQSSWPRIFQVPHYLRKVNKEAYEPGIISIGPYHRQKDHLKAMETHKVRFLKDLLRGRGEYSAQRYVELMSDRMERARNCYSESLSISDSEFLEMMVLDGCFIVELIYKIFDDWMQDPLLKVDQIYSQILKDLILIENQLPFFVLSDQFQNIDCFHCLFEDLLGAKDKVGSSNSPTYDKNPITNVRHLPDLLRTNIWRPPQDSKSGSSTVQDGNGRFLIPSATELREAGIKFKKVDNRNLFDIRFENGTLEIPQLTIDDATEILYRNFIACEQFDDYNSPQHLTEYRKVLDGLINTGKDVELLCRKGIIEHWLGSYEEVATMINSLGTELMMGENFFYAQLFKEVNEHYNRRCNKTMASLRHNYFNSPWALISVLAAAFLLLCTLLQTTFTIFPRS
ncbi:hypothetical protein SLEP1_g32418 [Rubroshorea leprosula]|uniref:Uncharacterized protein n=1 Tax=Rubroshorea leprosula TaxID=152421 RepID=A0AAV5KD92_9ROSI|nr:hypothetical protein SLEP1_g32418 [Rubroshorea leprosula]